MGPVVDQVADENIGSLKVGKLNVDNCPKTANQYKVQSIPMLVIFQGGKPVKTLIGLQTKQSLQAAVSAVKG